MLIIFVEIVEVGLASTRQAETQSTIWPKQSAWINALETTILAPVLVCKQPQVCQDGEWSRPNPGWWAGLLSEVILKTTINLSDRQEICNDQTTALAALDSETAFFTTSNRAQLQPGLSVSMLRNLWATWLRTSALSLPSYKHLKDPKFQVTAVLIDSYLEFFIFWRLSPACHQLSCPCDWTLRWVQPGHGEHEPEEPDVSYPGRLSVVHQFWTLYETCHMCHFILYYHIPFPVRYLFGVANISYIIQVAGQSGTSSECLIIFALCASSPDVGEKNLKALRDEAPTIFDTDDSWHPSCQLKSLVFLVHMLRMHLNGSQSKRQQKENFCHEASWH